jgi:hypothetical protein
MQHTTLVKAFSFFAQFASCSVEMFPYTSREVASGAILCACDAIGDGSTAGALHTAVPCARAHECASQLRGACLARGLTPDALRSAGAPRGPPATLPPPPPPTGSAGQGDADGPGREPS